MRVLNNKYMRVFLVVVLMLSFSISSVFAATTVSVPYAEPSTGTTQGYVSTYRDNGYTDTFYWSVTPISGSGTTSSTVSVTVDSGALTFVMGGTSGVTYRATLVQLNTNTAVRVIYTGSFTSTEVVSHTYSGSTIKSFCARGNIGNLINNIGTGATLNISFGSDSTLVTLANELNSIAETLELISSRVYNIQDIMISQEGYSYLYLIDLELDRVTNRLENIYSGVDNVESYLSQLKSSLDTIKDYMVDDQTTVVYSRLILDILRDFNSTELDESTEPLPDDNIIDFDSSSSDLRNESDVSSSLDDVFNDADIGSFSNGFSVVWSLVERIFNTNPVLFLVVTLVLSLGLIQLIFNRR